MEAQAAASRPGGNSVSLAAPPGLQSAWERLPPSVKSALAGLGVTSVMALKDMPWVRFLEVIEQESVAPFWRALVALQAEPFDFSLFLQRLMTTPRAPTVASVNDALGLPTSRFSRPSPSDSLAALSSARQAGRDVGAILDCVLDSRTGSSIADSTATRYASHLSQIRRGCYLLNVPLVPASLDTIRRVSAIVNHPSTLRGWLSAWRHLHTLARLPWPGDRDVVLFASRAGLARRIGPPPPRRRLRRKRLLSVLRLCVANGLYLEGAAAALSYTFCLRVPSELLRQAAPSLFTCHGHAKISYGPIRRKGKSELSRLTRFCVCSTAPLLCPHPWVRLLQESPGSHPCFPFSASVLMRRLHPLLAQSGIPEAEARQYTSHCFRRGSGVDMLE